MNQLVFAPRQRTFAGLGVDLGQYGNAQLAYGVQSYYGAATDQTLGLNYAVSLRDFGFLGFYASQSLADGGDTNLLLTWSMGIGDRRMLSSSLQQSSAPASAGGGFVGDVTLQRDLPAGAGTGYRVSLTSDDRQEAYLAYQAAAGMASIDYSSRNGDSGVRVGAAGALAMTGAGLMTSRTLKQSFAVVQVADYEGLTVFVDNQPVGRTDENGRVLVEALRPYENNAISVDPTQVPMDGSLSQSEIRVTPAFRSGALVRFPVERAYAATMRAVRKDGTPVPAGASARLGDRVFPVATDGLLYIEGLQGSSRLQLQWQGGQCTIDARRPTGNDPMPDLGNVPCR
jgi:outer membrane usher protein